MARLFKAPKHSVSAPAKYIDVNDSAWDHERINAELEALERDGDPLSHPYMRYLNGETRYDLGAEGILEYLDQSKEPETWHLRRLKLEERIRVEACSSEYEANCVAFACGVVKAENVPDDVAKLAADPKRLERTFLRVVDAYAEGAIQRVGNAVRLASQDLQYDEKKA